MSVDEKALQTARELTESKPELTPLPETSARLPPFLQEQVRHREAYLTLLKDLNVVLGQDWNENLSDTEIKRKINAAIADSLRIWI